MEEFFDALDENGEFIGKTVSRDDAHKNGTWHRAIVLFLVNDKKQVLLQKRSKFKRTWAGCWDLTSGGHVEAGELGLVSAIRELHEELGITVEPQDIRYICTCRSYQKNENIWDAHFNEYFVAFKNVDIKDIKLQENEVEEVKWVDFEDFKRMVENKNSSLAAKWAAFESLIYYIDKYGTN